MPKTAKCSAKPTSKPRGIGEIMRWDDTLTDKQKIVTKYIDTHACLLAGPGTGKTRCITRRIAYLIEEHKIKPEKILVLTFTRKATAEIRQRLTEVLGRKINVRIFTIHSYALTQLLKHGGGHMLPKPLRIADDYEEKEIIIKDLMSRLSYTKEQVEEELKNMQNGWEKLGDNKRTPDPRFVAAWNDHRRVFGYTLRSELVFRLNIAFEENSISPEQFDHIIVDEYQDLNACELNVIKALAKKCEKLYVAGDDDQSIYSFRNADATGIRKFDVAFPGSQGLDLKECKRSTPEILALGDYVIKQDLERIDKKNFTNIKASPGSVKILSFYDQNEEAKSISTLCKWLIDNKKCSPSDILILLRNNKHKIFSKPIVEELTNNGVEIIEASNASEKFNVPDTMSSETKKLGRLFVSYSRLLISIHDQLAWRSILMLENNGIGKKTIEEVMHYALENHITFYETLELIENGKLSIKARSDYISSAFQKVLAIINPLTRLSIKEKILSLADIVITDDTIKEEITGPIIDLIDRDNSQDLDSVLKSILVEESELNESLGKNGVNIMTMHQAKGLDSRIVILVGIEKELIPGRDTGTKEKDALRLLYVSITRAKEILILTHCKYRSGRQSRSGVGAHGVIRSLSTFVSNGPVKSESGPDYIRSLIKP